MAISKQGSGSALAGAAASFSFSLDAGANSSRGLIGCYSTWRSGAYAVVSGHTYNSVALTSEGERQDNDGTNFITCGIGSLINPASGSNSLVISFTTSVNCKMGGTAYYSADQTDLADGYTSNVVSAATSISTNVTSRVGDIVQDNITFFNSSPAAGAGQTEEWNENSASFESGASSTESGATTVTMSWTFSSDSVQQACINVRASATTTTYPGWYSSKGGWF